MKNAEMILGQDETGLSLGNIQDEVDKIKMKIESGDLNALDVTLKAKFLNDVTTSLMKQIKSPAMDEIENYSSQDSIRFGATFKKRNGYEKLAYSDDSIVADLEAKLKERKALLKDARTSQKKGIIHVTEDGETIEPPSIDSVTADSIVITFKK